MSRIHEENWFAFVRSHLSECFMLLMTFRLKRILKLFIKDVLENARVRFKFKVKWWSEGEVSMEGRKILFKRKQLLLVLQLNNKNNHKQISEKCVQALQKYILTFCLSMAFAIVSISPTGIVCCYNEHKLIIFVSKIWFIFTHFQHFAIQGQPVGNLNYCGRCRCWNEMWER